MPTFYAINIKYFKRTGNKKMVDMLVESKKRFYKNLRKK